MTRSTLRGQRVAQGVGVVNADCSDSGALRFAMGRHTVCKAMPVHCFLMLRDIVPFVFPDQPAGSEGRQSEVRRAVGRGGIAGRILELSEQRSLFTMYVCIAIAHFRIVDFEGKALLPRPLFADAAAINKKFLDAANAGRSSLAALVCDQCGFPSCNCKKCGCIREGWRACSLYCSMLQTPRCAIGLLGRTHATTGGAKAREN